MKKWLRRVLGEPLVQYTEMMVDAKLIYAAHTMDEAILAKSSAWRTAAQKGDAMFEQWFASFSELAQSIASASSRQEQLLTCRRHTLNALKEYVSIQVQFDEQFSEEERVILERRFVPDLSFEEAMTKQYLEYVYSSIDFRVLRMFAQKFFDDAKDNDWSDMFAEQWRAFSEMTCRSMIAAERDESNPSHDLARMMLTEIRELEEGILQGRNWDREPEKIVGA